MFVCGRVSPLFGTSGLIHPVSLSLGKKGMRGFVFGMRRSVRNCGGATKSAAVALTAK